VESGSVFATAYRTSPSILHGKTTTPQHTIFRAWPYFWERERVSFNYRNTRVLSEKVHVLSCYWRSSVFMLSVFGAPWKKS
jgi:hypothetical protein